MDRLTRICFYMFCFILLFANLVAGECTCDAEEEGNTHKSEARKYKIVAIVSILLAGGIGVFIPALGKIVPALSPEKDIFFVIKAFAAGVILATAFIHVLPDAFDNLTSPCLPQKPWGDFPFTGFIAMVASIGVLMIDSLLTSYHTNSYANKAQTQPMGDEENTSATSHEMVPVHTHATHGHSHPSHLPELGRHRVTTLVLESGIAVHSVIIGLALGASESPDTIKPLVGALTFHQLFEGMGLGGCIFQAKFKSSSTAIMGLIFSLSTPIGIVLGIIVSTRYKENSPTALAVEGSLNAASSGVLIYMALVDLLAADFMNPKVQSKAGLRAAVNVALLLGAGLMSLIAKWA